MEDKSKSLTQYSFPHYSWGLKITLVEEIENGQLSISQAAKKYGVSRSAVEKWVKKYGNLDRKLREMGGKSPKQEIKELKKKLDDSELKNSILETMLDILEEDYGIDVLKKHYPEWHKRIKEKGTND